MAADRTIELAELKRKVSAFGGMSGTRGSGRPGWPRPCRPPRRAVVERSRCTGCGICGEICPRGAIRVTYVANVEVDRCRGCGLCVENCPRGAISLSGEKERSA